ncbi:MAG: anthranilate phosphoribosyltransferase, partial [Butyricicoccus porcorum]
LVVYGQDRMDEISISAPTTVCDFGGGEYKTYTIQPEDFGLSRAQKSDITGGSAEENAQITRAILSGTERGAKRDIVLMNAGAALYISGKAASIADGIKLAAEMIDSGKAMETLNAYIAVSNA